MRKSSDGGRNGLVTGLKGNNHPGGINIVSHQYSKPTLPVLFPLHIHSLPSNSPNSPSVHPGAGLSPVPKVKRTDITIGVGAHLSLLPSIFPPNRHAIQSLLPPTSTFGPSSSLTSRDPVIPLNRQA